MPKTDLPRWRKVKKAIKCVRCGYEWATTSVMMFVSCANCNSKIRNPHYSPKDLGLGDTTTRK